MQAKAPETKSFGKEAFTSLDGTVIRWLGNAGALINSRGTTIITAEQPAGSWQAKQKNSMRRIMLPDF